MGREADVNRKEIPDEGKDAGRGAGRHDPELNELDADGLDETLEPIWEPNEERSIEEELVVTDHRDRAAELEPGPEGERLQEALEGERAIPADAGEDVLSSPARRGTDRG